MVERLRGNAPGRTAAEVARNVKRYRLALGLTQGQLSERMGALGRPVRLSGISKIEAVARAVEVDDLVALARALDVLPGDLLGGEAVSVPAVPVHVLRVLVEEWGGRE